MHATLNRDESTFCRVDNQSRRLRSAIRFSRNHAWARLCGRLFVLTLTLQSVSRADERQDKPRLLKAIETAPVYVRNDDDKSKWPAMIRDGIDASRDYFGNYGPVYVYVLGHEDKALNTDVFHRRLIHAYCEHRAPDDLKSQKACRSRMTVEFLSKVRSGQGDAYLSYVDRTRPPIAELVFINPHKFRDPYLHTRGIHEYTHVFQRSFPTTPTWMMEGGAEFYASYLGEKRGWAGFRNDMQKYLENVRHADEQNLSIADMEDVEGVTPEVKKYYRHLAYDAGAWAVAFMIRQSDSGRASDLPKKFYPLVRQEGWERALVQYTRSDSKEDFYQKFESFLKKPDADLLKMLDEIRD